jgi:uncharacterized protein
VLDPPRVLSLHRYLVKSMLGEQVARLDIGERGCSGDRMWSVRTAADKIGSGKNTRRFAALPGLLELRAEEDDGRVVVILPDGSRCAVDGPDAAQRVSRHVGQPVRLAMEITVSHFDDGPVSMIGRASIEAVAERAGEHVDASRFRANILLDAPRAFMEDEWVGRHVGIGTAVLEVSATSPRCVMVDAKTADLPAQPGNLAVIGRLNDAHLGVVARVAVPGTVSVGDALTIR